MISILAILSALNAHRDPSLPCCGEHGLAADLQSGSWTTDVLALLISRLPACKAHIPAAAGHADMCCVDCNDRVGAAL